jgi:ribonucleoside-diphosphate reductase alpha chain
MMGAAQPFISGAISKTINLPSDASVEDITACYRLSWELGLKANALYRDGCKLSQPLSSTSDSDKEDGNESEKKATTIPFVEAKPAGLPAVPPSPAVTIAAATPATSTSADSETEEMREAARFARTAEYGRAAEIVPEIRIVERPMRRRLPETRASITHKFNIAGHEGYLTVGLYEDGMPGELFITMAKEGSTIGGLMDSLGTAVSVALQYGVPVDSLVNKFTHQRFEPAGLTTNREIPFAKSLVDYIFRWMGMEFIPGYRELNSPMRSALAVGSAGDSDSDALRHGDGGGSAVNRAIATVNAVPGRTGFRAQSPAGSEREVTDDLGNGEAGDGGDVMEDSQAWSVEQAREDRGLSTPPRHGAGGPEFLGQAMMPGPASEGSVSTTVTVSPGAGQKAVVRAVASTSRNPRGGGRVAVMADVLSQSASQAQADAPACDSCGSITIRSGTCYKCMNCGNSMGCS